MDILIRALAIVLDILIQETSMPARVPERPTPISVPADLEAEWRWDGPQ